MKAQIWEVFGNFGQSLRVCVPITDAEQYEQKSDVVFCREILIEWLVDHMPEEMQAEVAGYYWHSNAYTTRNEPFLLREQATLENVVTSLIGGK